MLSEASPFPDLRVGICKALGYAARHTPPFRGKCRVGRVLSGVILRRRSVNRIEVIREDGCRLLLDPRSRTEAGAFYNGAYDQDDIDFFKICAGQHGIVFDVGANVGLIAVPLARYLRDGGRLFAFEPVPANAEALRANLRLNNLSAVTEVFECALGESGGSMRIGRETANGSATGNAYLEASAASICQPLEWTIVPVRRLDDVITQELRLHRVDLIKIDVEGAELDVLRGALKTLQQFRPMVYGEFQLTLRPVSSGTFADVGALLKELDYRALAFTGRLRLLEIPFEAGRGNAVLCPEEKLPELLERCRSAAG